MDSQITFLFLLIILFDAMQAVPKIHGITKTKDSSFIDDKIKVSKKNLRQREPGRIEEDPPLLTLNNEKANVADTVVDDATTDERVPNAELNADLNKSNIDTYTDRETINVNAEDSYKGENDENDENGWMDNRNKKIEEVNEKSRSLEVGDTFVPHEMLEIAKRLILKVKIVGKGIVSSAKNAYELADRLFDSFFLTMNRIVILRDVDIPGLDALQALSLSGEVVDKLRTSADSFTETPIESYKGFKLQPAMMESGYDYPSFSRPRKCHYKVLRKLIKSTETMTSESHPGHKKNKISSHSFLRNGTIERLQNNTAKGNVCRWAYSCQNQLLLQSCRLHSVCTNNETARKNDNAELSNLERFRKMVGVDIIDEEVEKIIEAHALTLQGADGPQKLSLGTENKIESLSEYFNQILMAEEQATTPSMADA